MIDNTVLGLHHVTAIAGNAKRNYDFYTQVLGQRLVKKTVNFDDPGTYHFYYGNEVGTPGTILTFFPWEGIGAGRNGSGMATDIGYAVPLQSLGFWEDRLKEFNVTHSPISENFSDQQIAFTDPDGLRINLIASGINDQRKPWVTSAISAEVATTGFHSIVLTLNSITATAKILTDIFGYKLLEQQGNRYRFITAAIENASIVDLVEEPGMPRGHNAAGTNHHVAFRVSNEKVLMEFRDKILTAGHQITPKIDRDYFFSLYFREPGGVLFELATDNPGFATDETVAELGSSLRLPARYESSRSEIETLLPKLS
jgi:glyoxalase family protein